MAERHPNSTANSASTRSALVPASVAAAVVLLLISAAAPFARWHWAVDLLTHFPVQLSVAALIVLLVLVGLRRWKLALLPLLVVTLNASRIAPFYLASGELPRSGRVVRALVANVHTGNRAYQHLLEYVRHCQPDFVVVLEVDENWLGQLSQLGDLYPYRVAHPRADNFGIGLFSRFPIKRQAVLRLGDHDLPTIVATLTIDDREVQVIGTHPLPPTGGRNSASRNAQLRELAGILADLPDPRILLGDLNVTSWSPHFADLIEDSALRDGRIGFGVQPTWPRLPWLFRIPIDHTLVSGDLQVVDRSVGPDIHSDHRPVCIDFEFTSPKP